VAMALMAQVRPLTLIGGHRRCLLLQSTSASRFTAGAFGSSSSLGRKRQGDQSLIACGSSKTVSITF
jgi:hypothetical protein